MHERPNAPSAQLDAKRSLTQTRLITTVAGAGARDPLIRDESATHQDRNTFRYAKQLRSQEQRPAARDYGSERHLTAMKGSRRSALCQTGAIYLYRSQEDMRASTPGARLRSTSEAMTCCTTSANASMAVANSSSSLARALRALHLTRASSSRSSRSS